MKAHVLGFSWDFTGGYGKNLTLNDLGAQLSSMNDNEFEFGSYQRVLYAENNEERITGLLLTAKNHKKFCELRRQGKVRKINVRQAEEGSSLIDFNFFLIDKKFGRGLYQYYHNSCAARIFTRLCREQFEKIAESKITEEIAKAGGKKCPDATQDAIRDKYGGDIICNMHVRRENFADIVQQMQKISSCDFGLATINPEQEKWFGILKGVSKAVRHRVSFVRKATVAERASAIVSLVNSGQTDDATVTGVDEDGLERIITLANNPDSFGHWDYDDIAGDMTFDPSKFSTSKFMQMLLSIAEKQKADFLHKKAK